MPTTKLPLWELEDIEDVPIPNTEFVTLLPADFKHVDDSVVFIHHSSLEPKSSAGLAGPMGVICRLKDTDSIGPSIGEDSEHGLITLYEYEAVQRVIIKDYSPGNIETSNYTVIHNDLDTPDSVCSDAIKKVKADISAMYTAVMKNDMFTYTLQSDLYIVKESPAKIVNIIADCTLPTAQDRIEYLYSLSAIKQWELTLKGLQLYIERAQKAKKRIQNGRAKPSPKRKIKARIIDDPSAFDVPEPSEEEAWLALLEKMNIEDKYKKKLRSDIAKHSKLMDVSSEKQNLWSYLDTFFSIPWDKQEAPDINLTALIETLSESHHGLDNVKNHILEHMVVEARTGGSTGAVMCFSGPPGTGKTSIAKAIAKATGRKLIRIAVGGMKDEAHLRGHRRTYVGSKCGRIIEGLKESNSMAPIILIDEIDKLDTTNGDPSSALLEILDPEQNNVFLDYYIDVPVDLSKVMFICTANDERRLQPALRDRMQFVRFENYEKEDRVSILRDYIYPKSLSLYNITLDEVDLTDEAVHLLTEELQVRQIEKNLSKCLRRAAVQLDIHGESKVVIDSTFVVKVCEIKTSSSRKVIGFQ